MPCAATLQATNEELAAHELGPSPIVATVAATWGDRKRLYSISTYAGVDVSEYRRKYDTRLEELQEWVCAGEVPEEVLTKAIEMAKHFEIDDFMRLVTSMLINISKMQALVSGLLVQAWTAVGSLASTLYLGRATVNNQRMCIGLTELAAAPPAEVFMVGKQPEQAARQA
jgi:hypothetical protein